MAEGATGGVDGCPANLPGLFDRPMVMGTAGKIFFGQDENNVGGGSARFASPA